MFSSTATPDLVDIAQKLSAEPKLNSFRLVGGTAIALQLGHRKSVDIDFFTNKEVSKKDVSERISSMFPNEQLYVTTEKISGAINGVRVELYDDWSTPFLDEPIVDDGIRMATLKDLAAFKLDAIVGRREKKDYVDLYVLFQALGVTNILKDFKLYNPNVSPKSILFALGEVNEARFNKSVMPEMVAKISWDEVEKSMVSAAREFMAISEHKATRSKGRGI